MTFPRTRLRQLVPLAALALAAERGAAQSLLDRPPNLSAAWVPAAGVMQFNFSHRFSRSPAPERKITGFPSFTLALGLPARTAGGFVYATNSALMPGYPNEWEFFGRVLAISQATGSVVDVGVQASYNLATEGFDGELSLARRWGRARIIGVARTLSAGGPTGGRDAALGGGATLGLSRYLAIAGDIVSLVGPDLPDGRRVSWSAGLHAAIPSSPHTLSIHATNTAGTTLQAASRPSGETRFGFEFTIPITLARYFGRRDPAPSVPVAADADTVRVSIRGLRFNPPAIAVRTGMTVVWVNDDPLEHTATAADGSFDSGLITPGARWARTFSAPGVIAFACRPHPFMHGSITVGGRR